MFVRSKGVILAGLTGMVGAATMLPGLAMADDSGFGAAVLSTITASKADVTLIGVAVLGVIVLIAAIAWVSRAINK